MNGHPIPSLTADRIISAGRRGSSRPVIVQTSDGPRLVKLRGAAQGTGPLVAEIVVAALASELGLAVPQRSLIELPPEIETADWDDELADLLAASVGLNLGFDFLDGAREFARSDIERVASEIRATILWLDRLVSNPDRTIRNPNLLWWRDRLWLIDHGAALGFQYGWVGVSESTPREPGWTPEAHLFEAVVPNEDLRAIDAAFASSLTREVIDAAVAQVPDTFLRPLAGDGSADRRRAAYAAFLWKRLRAPRPFLASRQLPPERPRGRPPQWLTRR